MGKLRNMSYLNMMHKQKSVDIASRQTNRSVEENRNSKDRSIHKEATDF